jgi:hypothetical protein
VGDAFAAFRVWSAVLWMMMMRMMRMRMMMMMMRIRQSAEHRYVSDRCGNAMLLMGTARCAAGSS